MKLKTRNILIICLGILIIGNTLMIQKTVKSEENEDLRGIRDFDEILEITEGTRSADEVDYLLYEHHGGMWCDAEKTIEDTEDDVQCWAGAASNVLEWTGWGLGVESGVDDCDDIFQEFQDHWKDTGGYEHNAWHWWFDGTYPDEDVDITGGGYYYSSLTWSDYFHQTWHDRRGSWDGLPADDLDIMEALDHYLHQGWGVTLGFPSHAITAWGFRYDPSYGSEDFENYYVGIYITDPDDDKNNDPDDTVMNEAEDYPNNLRYYTVNYDSDEEKWRLPGYSTAEGWPIDSFFAFEPYQSSTNTHRPIARTGGPYTSSEGFVVSFDGSSSIDADGNSLVYRWDINNDGTWDSGWSSDPYEVSYFDDYSGDITVQVSDGHLRDVATSTITVNNLPPGVDAGLNKTVDEGEVVLFSATVTDPGFYDTHTYEWDFETDGTIDSTGLGLFNPTHVYPHEGTYQVTVYVTDDDGGWDYDDLFVTVENVAPIVDAGPDQTVNEGETVHFTGDFDDPGLDTYTIVWDFDDGILIEGELNPDHSYCGSRIYVATLTVTDDEGAEGSDTCNITVLNVPPTANAGSDQIVNEGETVSFSGIINDAGTCDIITYEWSFDDSTPKVSDTLTPTHTYGDNGVFIVTLTVTDDDGATTTDTLTVTVNNVLPTITSEITMTPPYIENPEYILPIVHTLEFSITATDPGSDDLTYTWNWDDGTTDECTYYNDGTNPDGYPSPNINPITQTDTITHIYSESGSYYVTVTITDDDTGTATSLTYEVTVLSPDVAVDNINNEIQELSEGVFKGKADKRKASFDNMFHALQDMYDDEEYNGMIQFLNNNIKSKIDSWITDSDTQSYLYSMIDFLTAHLETIPN